MTCHQAEERTLVGTIDSEVRSQCIRSQCIRSQCIRSQCILLLDKSAAQDADADAKSGRFLCLENSWPRTRLTARDLSVERHGDSWSTVETPAGNAADRIRLANEERGTNQ